MPVKLFWSTSKFATSGDGVEVLLLPEPAFPLAAFVKISAVPEKKSFYR